MKKVIAFALMAASSLVTFQLSAQQSGTVEYNETVKFDIHVDGDASMLPPGIPNEHTMKKILHFTPAESIYVGTNEDEETQQVNDEEDGNRVFVRISEPDEITYVNFKEHRSVDQREFMSRMFLIESPLDSVAWKLTGNRREILGYPCLEATCMNDSILTIAWFTPSIQVPAGPARFNGLPGLILELITNEGKRIISAASVKLEDVAGMIIKPNKGKKMSRKEFNKMVDEKRAEMGEGGGGNHIVIKIRQ
ncbi:MAG: GLPGLI family protein [Chloroflexota bacterium]|nr:GLPGLI family protein [Lentimicrobium sp.]